MAEKKAKSAKKLERHFKGVSNHWRIQMLLYIGKHADASLEDLMEALDGNQKTFSEHTRRLVQAGLVEKSYEGRAVKHRLTPYGEIFERFIRSFGNL